MQTPAAGRNDIPNRLKRHFAIFAVPTPTPAALASIFGPIVRGRFDATRVPSPFRALAPATVPATVALWQACRAKLLPTPDKPHYAFTLRDVAPVVRGLVLADREALAAADAATGTTATASSLISLWAHECCRVFGDRAVTEADAAWVATRRPRSQLPPPLSPPSRGMPPPTSTPGRCRPPAPPCTSPSRAAPPPWPPASTPLCLPRAPPRAPRLRPPPASSCLMMLSPTSPEPPACWPPRAATPCWWAWAGRASRASPASRPQRPASPCSSPPPRPVATARPPSLKNSSHCTVPPVSRACPPPCCWRMATCGMTACWSMSTSWWARGPSQACCPGMRWTAWRLK